LSTAAPSSSSRLASFDPSRLAKLSSEELAELETLLVAEHDDGLSRDPWRWACETHTQDEADGQIKPFPRTPYLRDMFTVLAHRQMISIPKSRRMRVTWGVAAFCAHAARYNPSTAVFWQADNEDKAAFVVQERIAFLERSLPPELQRPHSTIRTSKGMIGRISWTNAGYVWGVPQGDSVLRTYTPSILVMDECDFQPEAHAALAAALPFVEKNAKLILITTSNGPQGVVAEIAKSVGFESFPSWRGRP